jgi:hypothetical protein
MMCLVTSFVFKRLSRSVFFTQKVFCFVRSTVKGQSLVRLFPALPDVVTACSEKLQKNAWADYYRLLVLFLLKNSLVMYSQ